MGKKSFALVSLILIFSLFTPKVLAFENYYQNENGVILSKEEYDFLSYMFWDGCQELMTSKEYDDFIKSNIMNGELGIEFSKEILTRGTLVEDNSRTLKIAKSCSSDCLISVTMTWKGNPTIKSYDVMGAYLENTQLVNTPKSVIGQTSYTDIQKFNNGFGVSMLLPKYDSTPVANQTFRVNKGGTVYANYQHAQSSVTLNESKNYNFSTSGYGGVIKFNNSSVAGKYDQMGGVSVTL